MEIYTTSQRVLSPVFAECILTAPSYTQLKAIIADRHLSTAEHSIRVRICATTLGLELGLIGEDLTTLTIAADIHDIGKLRISPSILNKKMELSEAEWQIVREHPAWGAETATQVFPYNPEIAQCIMQHHERLDGSGYPNAMCDSDIPLLARILAVADAFIALTENRSYRHAFSEREALHILKNEERGRYDDMVLKVLARTKRISAN